jgi:hypothetical protein
MGPPDSITGRGMRRRPAKASRSSPRRRPTGLVLSDHPSAGARASDAVAAGREHDASDLTAPSDGTLRARQHPGSVRTGESGGGRALVVFAVLAGFIAVIVRRAGLA